MTTRSPITASYWSEDDAREVLALLDRSSLSVARFAAEHGLSSQRLHYWRKRLATPSGPIAFVPLVDRRPGVHAHAATQRHPAVIKITLGLVCARVPGTTDPETVARLMLALHHGVRAC